MYNISVKLALNTSSLLFCILKEKLRGKRAEYVSKNINKYLKPFILQDTNRITKNKVCKQKKKTRNCADLIEISRRLKIARLALGKSSCHDCFYETNLEINQTFPPSLPFPSLLRKKKEEEKKEREGGGHVSGTLEFAGAFRSGSKKNFCRQNISNYV